MVLTQEEDKESCMEVVGHGLCDRLLDAGNGMRGGQLSSLLLALFLACRQQPCLCITLVQTLDPVSGFPTSFQSPECSPGPSVLLNNYLPLFLELSLLLLLSGCIISLQTSLQPDLHSHLPLAQSWCCCLTLSILATVLRKKLPLKISGQPHPSKDPNKKTHHKKKKKKKFPCLMCEYQEGTQSL